MGQSAYDPTLHGKNRLGICGAIPLVPMMPTGAQIRGPWGAHYKLLGDSYVRGPIPHVAPSQFKTVMAAIQALPTTDPSYSGSGSLYRALTVEPSEDGRTFTLKAGSVTMGIGYVDPAAPIVSTDESMEDQINGADEG